MRIQLDGPNGSEIIFEVCLNKTAKVYVNDTMVGSCRWEKDGDNLRLRSLPLNTFSEEEDTGEKLVFKLDK